jgi:hypothetical protein
MIGRRGFLGTLAGMLLGAKLGPKILPAPSPDIWRAAPRLPMFPRENRYVALHQFLGRTIEEVHRQTEWLRLKRAIAEPMRYGWRFGDTVQMCPPIVFTPHVDHNWSTPNPYDLVQRYVPVNLIHRAHVMLDLRGLDWDVPLGQFTARNIEPLASKMAVQIRDAVERSRGAELIVCAEQPSLIDVHRSVTLQNEDYGLTIRGTEDISPYKDVPHINGHFLHVEMLFGLTT